MGRKRSIVWELYNKKSSPAGSVAECKFCLTELKSIGNPSRLRLHVLFHCICAVGQIDEEMKDALKKEELAMPSTNKSGSPSSDHVNLFQHGAEYLLGQENIQENIDYSEIYPNGNVSYDAFNRIVMGEDNQDHHQESWSQDNHEDNQVCESNLSQEDHIQTGPLNVLHERFTYSRINARKDDNQDHQEEHEENLNEDNEIELTSLKSNKSNLSNKFRFDSLNHVINWVLKDNTNRISELELENKQVRERNSRLVKKVAKLKNRIRFLERMEVQYRYLLEGNDSQDDHLMEDQDSDESISDEDHVNSNKAIIDLEEEGHEPEQDKDKLMKNTRSLPMSSNYKYYSRPVDKLKTLKNPGIRLEKVFECPHDQCHFSTRYEKRLDLHLNKMHIEYVCNWPGCDFTCSKNYALKKHICIFHENEKLNCDWPGCDYSSKYEYSLRSHKASHTGEKPFKCMKCDQVFSTHRGLRTHKLTHLSKLPCSSCYWPGCGKQFSGANCKEYLKRHIIIHENKKTQVCDYDGCQFRCNLKSELRTHFEIKHNQSRLKRFACQTSGCGRQYYESKPMRAHARLMKHDFLDIKMDCFYKFQDFEKNKYQLKWKSVD